MKATTILFVTAPSLLDLCTSLRPRLTKPWDKLESANDGEGQTVHALIWFFSNAKPAYDLALQLRTLAADMKLDAAVDVKLDK